MEELEEEKDQIRRDIMSNNWSGLNGCSSARCIWLAFFFFDMRDMK